MNIRYNNYYFDTSYSGNYDYSFEDRYKILSFDYFHYRGYNPLTTLKKCYYEHYLRIEIDLFRIRFSIHFGKTVPVQYEIGLDKYREKQKARREKETK